MKSWEALRREMNDGNAMGNWTDRAPYAYRRTGRGTWPSVGTSSPHGAATTSPEGCSTTGPSATAASAAPSSSSFLLIPIEAPSFLVRTNGPLNIFPRPELPA
jgi:hypothetical protein